MRVSAGTKLGHYQISSLLGAGGMGEVYLAQDTRLRRPVALKILPADFTQDHDRLSRFEQEAYAASVLNHPNILTIYEIGQVDDIRFIATEFIAGVTLRQQINATQMELVEVLDTAIQIASALAAAHQASIVHRDLKPENIMVRHDGYIKVLDFGLAKLTEHETLAHDPEAETVQAVKTRPGQVMGTVTYMSPEQTRGLAVDGYDEALVELDQGVAIEPNHPLLNAFRAEVLFHRGDSAAAASLYREVLLAHPEINALRPLLAASLSTLGEHEAARAQLTEAVKEVAVVDWDVPYWLASVYAMEGERDEALEWLERAISLGNENLPWFQSDKVWEPFRADERFKAPMRRFEAGLEKLT